MPLDNSDERFDDLDTCTEFAGKHLREDTFLGTVTVTGLWLARELEYIRSKTYDRLLPGMNADRLVPDNTDAPEWIETITVRMYDAVGMAKVVSNYADDLPRADVTGAYTSVQVRTLGDSYGYNVNELRASRATGVGLDARKAAAARRAMDLKIASIKLKGDPDYGLNGLFTHPNIPQYVFPNAGAWSGLTGDQIYQNLTAMAGAYTLQNLGVHIANFLAMAPQAYLAASTKFVSGIAGMPVTALGLFQANNPGVSVVNVWECAGAGQGAQAGKDVILLYERSVDNLAHEYIMPFSQLPADARNLEIVVDCLARSGGVNIYYPMALLEGYTS